MGGSSQNAAFLGRELVSELVGVDELVSLSGRQAAHSADCPVDGLPAIGRQLLELLKELTRLLLLIGSQVLPGLHAIEHALLLLWRQTGKMLQLVLQPFLLLGRKLAELRIVFEGAALLSGRQIFIAAEPVSGVAGLVLRWMRLIGAGGVGMTLGLKPVPLPVRVLRLGRPGLGGQILGERVLGERQRQQQERCQTVRECYPAQHTCPLNVSSPYLRACLVLAA